MNKYTDIVFALDIGTRTIIGLLLKKIEKGFKIVASEVREHDKRAMLDGQIHNVNQVTGLVKDVKKSLEKSFGIELKKVSIAAAGRALKTEVTEHTRDLSSGKSIEEEDVRALDFAAVQKIQKKLSNDKKNMGPGDYHFIGYSVMEYRLDGIKIGSLVGQKGKNMQVELVATFLPRIVIDSLLTVINRAGLEVKYITLEPIAASEIVIPKEMHKFNLALVDIGAGTSDIALTRDGSMIGYGMVPVAGDEITESLCEEYLLDYDEGERVKCQLIKKKEIEARTIMGEKIVIESKKALQKLESEIEKLADLITSRILDINCSSPGVVMCIGGGALTPGLVDRIADDLGLDKKRVGVKRFEGLNKIEGNIEGISGAQSLTPVGIGVKGSHYGDETVFVSPEVNGRRVQIFTPDTPRVSDALISAELDLDKLKGRPGMGMTCTVNGELKIVKGEPGEPGYVMLNNEKTELETPVESGDEIQFIPGKDGRDANAIISDVIPDEDTEHINITINGTEIEIKEKIYQNDEPVSPETPLKDGAEIIYKTPSTVGEVVSEVMEIPEDVLVKKELEFKFNGKKKKIRPDGKYIIKKDGKIVSPSVSLKDGMNLTVEENKNVEATVKDLFSDCEKEELEVNFNGKKLKISQDNYSILCNNKQVDLDYKINAGDVLEFKTVPLTVNSVLEYINYNISPSTKKRMQLKVNGEKASFSRLIEDGDEIKLGFEKG